MSHRLGTCTSCKAQYKVPASFQADRAKCKSCGGVVQIAPANGAAAPAKPAAPAAAARPVPARPVTAAPKPPPPPAAKPAAPKAEEKDSVRAAAAAAAERVRDAGRKGAAEAAPAGKGKSSPRSGAKERAGKRGARGDKEKSKAPMLAAVVVLLAAGGGGAWFLMRGGDEGPKAAETNDAVASAPAASTAEQAPAAEESAPAASEAPTEQAPAAEAATTDAQPAAEAPAAKPADEDIDLSVYPDEGKLPGTSDEDWTSIQEWTASFLDANAGAAGNRARGKLFERGREAFPALLNAMKRLDFSTDDGFRAGDLAQRFLMDVCNGQNFDWKYGTEPADVLFNKKVVRSWIKAWEQGRDVPKGWAKLTKTTEEEALKLFAVTGPFDAAAGAPAEAGASSSIDDL
jgi:hypothetical protein